jgi:HK97 family phage major capsid protein
MEQVTLKKAQRDLQSLLNECGREDFIRAKALYLKDVEVVDVEGQTVDPEAIDVMIALPVAAEVVEEVEEVLPKAEEFKEEFEEEEEEEEKGKPRKAAQIAAIVRKELAKTSNQKAHGMVKVKDPLNFGRKVSSTKNFANDEDAYRFGRWCFAAYGHKKSAQWCGDHGIQMKAHIESVNSQGGYLVPEEFSSSLINLREEYGVARNNCHIEPMASDVKRIPRRAAGLTAYWVGEASAITQSTSTFDQVNLVAKKLSVLTKTSNELQEDSLVNIGDFIAGEIAYQFALKEDDALFNGDGAATYGGITGLVTNMAAGGKTTGSAGSTGATLPSDIVVGDLANMMSKLPDYGDNSSTKFYMHRATWFGGVQRIMYEQSGATTADGGLSAPLQFMGYPVVFVNAMTAPGSAWAAATPICYFGDMSLAAYLGDRRATSIAFSDSAASSFEQDELAIRGTERVDIVTTNLGDASSGGALVSLLAK